MNRDFETIVNNNPDAVNHYSATGAAMSIAANRISFTFHLTGPSFAVDSACSSSLVALHSACHGIRQGKEWIQSTSCCVQKENMRRIYFTSPLKWEVFISDLCIEVCISISDRY